VKIVHLITRFGLGGAEENTFKSCVHQQASGHDVYAVFGPDSKPDYYRAINSDIKYLEIPSLIQSINPLKDLSALRELVVAFKTIKPDVVHTHTSKAGILGRIAARMTRTNYIVHGVHILPFVNVGVVERMLYLSLEHLTASFTDLFVHVSDGTRTAYLKEHIGDALPHVVVRSGMEVEQFREAGWPKNWRDMLDIGPEDAKPSVLLMMAALDKRKRHEAFLNGFAAATTHGDSVRLLLAGEGPERPNIEAQIKQLNLEDRVKLLGHYPAPEQIVALSDVGVLASEREGLPRVVIQYFAGDRPVVVSPIEAIDEVVDDEVNGCIVRSEVARDVAHAAVALISNNDRLLRLTGGARQTNVEAWSLRSMFNALDDSYALMIANKRRQIMDGTVASNLAERTRV
jgi:glycosyltransferase involved in cell wall biosynthesis